MTSSSREVDAARETLRETVKGCFAGPEPKTVREVAGEVGVSTSMARDRLQSLVATGELATKTVGDERIWYRAPDALPEERRAAPVDLDEYVDRIVSELDVPGTSQMMRTWRRDAIRAAVAYLREHRSGTAGQLQRAVYPGHAAGYDDRSEWWSMVRPRLLDLPVVVEDGTELRFSRPPDLRSARE